jgi:hypothetical protein
MWWSYRSPFPVPRSPFPLPRSPDVRRHRSRRRARRGGSGVGSGAGGRSHVDGHRQPGSHRSDELQSGHRRGCEGNGRARGGCTRRRDGNGDGPGAHPVPDAEPSKGPAVWAPRMQCDRGLYPRRPGALERHERWSSSRGWWVAPLERGRVAGVKTESGFEFRARSVVLTAGTFLRGRIHVGAPRECRRAAPETRPPCASRSRWRRSAWRWRASRPARHLASMGAASTTRAWRSNQGRAPTIASPSGSAPRSSPSSLLDHLDGRGARRPRARPSRRVRALRRRDLGRGPRYCPSIEDKIVKFPDAPRHQIFLEPEGLDTREMYVNGLSTSLPADVQERMLRSIPGWSRCG